MKPILILLCLSFATKGFAQKYVIGAELQSFMIANQKGSTITNSPNFITTTNFNQKNGLLTPVFSFQKIQKNNTIFGVELGYMNNWAKSNAIENDMLNGQFVNSYFNVKRNMFTMSASCSKIIKFDKFIFIAGAYIPFSLSPKSNYYRNDTVIDATTNKMTRYQNQNGQNPNYLETGIRFRTELNYPIYKNLHIATKLNFGFDYERYFGETTYHSTFFDGTTIYNYSESEDYKNINILSKHFSFGVGLKYFIN